MSQSNIEVGIIAEEWLKNAWSVKGLILGLTLSAAIIYLYFSSKVPAKVAVSTWALVSVLWTLCWTWKRVAPIASNKIVIGIAINQSDQLSQDLLKALKHQILLHGLDQEVFLIALPSDVSFLNAKKAEKYILRRNISTLVWGDRIGKTDSRLKLRISYQCPERKKELVKNKINLGVKRSNWDVRSDTLDDIEVVSDNIFEISLFALAISLAHSVYEADVKFAVKLLFLLREKFKSKIFDPNFPALPIVRKTIEKELTITLLKLSVYHVISGNWTEVKKFSEYGISIAPTNPEFLINLARSQWELGDEKGARQTNDNLLKHHSKDPRARINAAFFALIENEFRFAISHYKKLKKCKTKTNMLDVAEFLQRQWEKTNLPQLLFGSAHVQYYYADKSRGMLLATEFIKLTSNLSGYELLIKEAKNLT